MCCVLSRWVFSLSSAGNVCWAKPNHAFYDCQQPGRFFFGAASRERRAELAARALRKPARASTRSSPASFVIAETQAWRGFQRAHVFSSRVFATTRDARERSRGRCRAPVPEEKIPLHGGRGFRVAQARLRESARTFFGLDRRAAAVEAVVDADRRAIGDAARRGAHRTRAAESAATSQRARRVGDTTVRRPGFAGARRARSRRTLPRRNAAASGKNLRARGDDLACAIAPGPSADRDRRPRIRHARRKAPRESGGRKIRRVGAAPAAAARDRRSSHALHEFVQPWRWPRRQRQQAPLPAARRVRGRSVRVACPSRGRQAKTREFFRCSRTPSHARCACGVRCGRGAKWLFRCRSRQPPRRRRRAPTHRTHAPRLPVRAGPASPAPARPMLAGRARIRAPRRCHFGFALRARARSAMAMRARKRNGERVPGAAIAGRSCAPR